MSPNISLIINCEEPLNVCFFLITVHLFSSINRFNTLWHTAKTVHEFKKKPTSYVMKESALLQN